MEAANDAYEAEYLKPVGRDDDKLAELKKAFTTAQDEADKYVVPNQFTEVAERNGAARAERRDRASTTRSISGRCRRTGWSFGRGWRAAACADVVPREFYKERDVVMEERRMRVDSDPHRAAG